MLLLSVVVVEVEEVIEEEEEILESEWRKRKRMREWSAERVGVSA